MLPAGFRARAHEMHIEEQFVEWANCLDDGRAKRDVRDKMPIHDVQMQPFRAGAADASGSRPSLLKFPAAATER